LFGVVADDEANLPNARKAWWYAAIRDLVDMEGAVLNPGELAEEVKDDQELLASMIRGEEQRNLVM
jgi:hypothetical protein